MQQAMPQPPPTTTEPPQEQEEMEIFEDAKEGPSSAPASPRHQPVEL